MKSPHFIVLLILTDTMAVSSLVRAAIDNAAPVVQLRTSCQNGTATLDNRFTTIGAFLGIVANGRTVIQ